MYKSPPAQSRSLTAYNRGSKNYVDPHSLSIIAFSFKGIENACYTIVGRNQFSEQLLYMKSVWVKLTRQIRISVIEIGTYLSINETVFQVRGRKESVSLNGSRVRFGE